MQTLSYVVEGVLRQAETGPEAQAGDQVKLFLNTDAEPDFPEFIYGVIQPPITRVQCGNATSYQIEYDEADLNGAVNYLVEGNVVLATVIPHYVILTEAEEAARIAADLVLTQGLAAEVTTRTALSATVTTEIAERIAADNLRPPALSFVSQTPRDASILVDANSNSLTLPYSGDSDGVPGYSDTAFESSYCIRDNGQWVLHIQAATYAFSDDQVDSPELVTNWQVANPENPAPVITLNGTPGVRGQLATSDTQAHLCLRPNPVKWERLQIHGDPVTSTQVTVAATGVPGLIHLHSGALGGIGPRVTISASLDLDSDHSVELPSVSGILAVVPVFADDEAAALSVAVGDVWWDSNLLKARVRLA